MTCIVCDDTGIIRIADVYKPICGNASIDWNTSDVIDCGCTQAKETMNKTVYIDVIKDPKPEQYDGESEEEYAHRLTHFQPYRWRAKSEGNGEPLCSGERYYNEADLIGTLEVLFGDRTNVYWRSRNPERGNQLLRLGVSE
jgi:hypothetical protein